MEASEFNKFRDIVYKQSGIVLSQEKKSLLENRIRRRLNQLGLKTESEYLEIIESDLTGDELIELIDAVSTNVTHFYREEAHFQQLGTILAQIKGQSQIKIWCAAASSGEEPYTIAFECLRNVPDAKKNTKILATDICTKVLRKACDGFYPTKSVATVPSDVRANYIEAVTGNPDLVRVGRLPRELLLFKRLNLVQFPYPLKGHLDVIFCRNVMIYFDLPTRTRIVQEFRKLLKPGGYLFLSHSESMLGIEHDFERAGNSVFRTPRN